MGIVEYDSPPDPLPDTLALASENQLQVYRSTPGIATLSELGEVVVTPFPPPPLRKHDEQAVLREVQTTNAAPAVVTLPLSAGTGYVATVHVLGVQDAAPFDRVSFRKAVQVIRAGGAAVLDGQEDLHAPFRSNGAATWGATVAVSGPNMTVSVVGQASKTINWIVRITFFRFNRDGLVD